MDFFKETLEGPVIQNIPWELSKVPQLNTCGRMSLIEQIFFPIFFSKVEN